MTGLLSGIPAVILAGGLGTRLRPVVADRPKALAMINGRPFLGYLLMQLARAGVREAVICTGYLAEQVRTCFGDSYAGIRLRYSVETEPLGTGGALRLALPLLAADSILVVNGDSYFSADLADFHGRHRAAGSLASLLLARVADISRFGAVDLVEGGQIARFEEKGSAAGPGLINAGVYLLSGEVVRGIPDSGPVSLEREVFPALVGHGLYGFAQDGKFIDIGTPEDYLAAAAFFAEMPDGKEKR